FLSIPLPPLSPLFPYTTLFRSAIYKAQCAVCHDNPAQSRAQPQAALKLMSPENILRSLESGRMKDQGSLLSPAQRRIISEYLAGKPLGQEGSAKPAPAATCANAKAPF